MSAKQAKEVMFSGVKAVSLVVNQRRQRSEHTGTDTESHGRELRSLTSSHKASREDADEEESESLV